MKSFSVITVLFLLFCFVSCKSDEETDFVPDPCVQEIVGDKFSHAYSVLSSYTLPVRNGDISIAGSLDRSRSFAQALTSFDNFDNVSGRSVSDGLPDFAGEKILLLTSDVDGVPADSLIRLEVSQLLCALDTIYHLSPYDLDGLGHKNRSKLIIFADPLHYISCKRNVEFISKYFGSQIPIIFPSEVSVRTCIEKISSKSLTVGYICDSTDVSSSVFGKVFTDVSIETGKTVNSFFSYMIPDNCQDPFLAFMDAYIASGNTCPLDALIVDSYSYDISKIKECSRNIKSILSPESLVYGKFLSDDFSVEGVYESTSKYCYKLMRQRNIFTHNITLPYSESFSIIQHPDSSIRSFILVPYVI